MYIVQKIEETRVTGEWYFLSFEGAKRLRMRLNESWTLYPRLIVDGEPYTITQAERLFRG